VASDINIAVKAAKKAGIKYGVALNYGDCASMANAVHCGGPKGDPSIAVENYFSRNHPSIKLSREQFVDFGQIVYNGLRGII
jgi:hypothetical protein